MKISWNSLKISIAGAKLSHLVQKDKIWDHGSMVEHVRTVFYQLEKEKDKNDEESLKKYMTINGYENYKMINRLHAAEKGHEKYSRVREIAVIGVVLATKKHPDLFTAFVKGYKIREPAENK